MLLRGDCKRLGDLAAATLVVHQPQRPPKVKLDGVTPVIPVVPLAPGDQAALVALAARARSNPSSNRMSGAPAAVSAA